MAMCCPDCGCDCEGVERRLTSALAQRDALATASTRVCNAFKNTYPATENTLPVLAEYDRADSLTALAAALAKLEGE